MFILFILHIEVSIIHNSRCQYVGAALPLPSINSIVIISHCYWDCKEKEKQEIRKKRRRRWRKKRKRKSRRRSKRRKRKKKKRMRKKKRNNKKTK